MVVCDARCTFPLTLSCARRIGFQYYKTKSYKLNFFESLSGIKFILNTDVAAPDMTDELKELYQASI